jgi:hypothetical protein
MSYLDLPRLVFAGRFQADVSTVNNDPEHFDTAAFQPNYQLLGQPTATGMSDGWWNPGGTGAWRFLDCVVTSVVYQDGTTSTNPATEPIIGIAINGAPDRVEGKLVDLDPMQQMVSEIWGFEVVVGERHGALGFGGRFVPSGFADIWARFPQGQPDSMFGAQYQSVLQDVGFSGGTESRFVAELAATGQTSLSIKFNVDGTDQDATSPTFTLGRVVGAIGPYRTGEPQRFVPKRRLTPTSPTTTAGYAAASLDGQVLTVDLGNSLPTASVGGPLADMGTLQVALVGTSGGPEVLAGVDYGQRGWFERTGSIVRIPLSPGQAEQAATTPLALVQNAGSPTAAVILAEDPSGGWVRADQFVFRLNPGDSATTRFYASSFGAPAAGATISLAFDPSQMASQIDQGPISGPGPVGQPESALTFPAQITTGIDGTAPMTLIAGDPGTPRRYIDGQMYGITYGLGDTAPPTGSVGQGNLILNALVWSGYQIPAHPSWITDVGPIFEQYADLYPVMRPIVDLSNYSSVMGRLPALRNVFDTPVDDPNYMPVTRDLSRAKRTMIRRWLDAPLYMHLGSVEDLTAALQQAIELEHATIPPYLCALYSLKSGANAEIGQLIRSVVIEEMLHLALVANILISIGGSPSIGHPGFVPTYPGALPGGLRDGLIVRLRRCSIEHIRDTFVRIEQPEVSRQPVDGRVDPLDPVDRAPSTIGWFYDEIERALERLNRKGAIEFGHLEQQVTTWSGPGRLFAIAGLDDAQRAIREIKNQGEGTGALRPGDGDHELAHYYKFLEIVAGRRLVRHPDGFAYDGDAIAFDPAGVWPMMDDPDVTKLAPGSRAAVLAGMFATTYQSLLVGLHETFNGHPERLGEAVGIMFSLDLAARRLMQTPSGLGDGTSAGPSFQVPFVT